MLKFSVVLLRSAAARLDVTAFAGGRGKSRGPYTDGADAVGSDAGCRTEMAASRAPKDRRVLSPTYVKGLQCSSSATTDTSKVLVIPGFKSSCRHCYWISSTKTRLILAQSCPCQCSVYSSLSL